MPGVAAVDTNLAKQSVTVTGEFEQSDNELAERFTEGVKHHGYTITELGVVPLKAVLWRDFAIGGIIAFLIVAGFLALQKMGIGNILGGTGMSYLTAFLVGIVASLSTCLAIVGGLVLTLSSTYAQSGKSWRPHAAFHVGRLVGFFILGGLIGIAGSTFQIATSWTAGISIAVGVVMFLLGLSLLEIMPAASRLLPRLPSTLHKRLSTQGSGGAAAPFFIGAATFFLPCGFTQSMQLYALSTGSFITGALTMFIFTLGTLPVLLLLSFGAFEVRNRSWRGIFFKAAGLLVIILALFNVYNALAVLGFVQPVNIF